MSSKPKYKQRHCFVPECRTGYRQKGTVREKIALFSVPKEDAMRQKWAKSISRADKKLDIYCCICEKHFDEQFIIRDYVHVINGEEVKVPRGYPSLTQDAYPTIFPNLPLSTSVSNKRKLLTKKLLTEHGKHLVNIEENDSKLKLTDFDVMGLPNTGGEEDAGLVANESKKRSNVNKFEKYFKSIDTSCQSEKDFLLRLREKNAKEQGDEESDTDDSGASSDGSLNDISLEDYMNENLPKHSKNGPIEEKIGSMRSKLMATVMKRALKRALLESEIKSAHARRAYFDCKKSFLTPTNDVKSSSGMPISFSDIKVYEDLKCQVMNEELAAKTEKRVLQKQLFEAEIHAATSKRGYYAAKKSTLLVPNDT